MPSGLKDIWRKKYFLNHFLILLKLGFEHIILSKMNLSNLGVLIFSKLHWILAFLENCCECADFIITNGKKSRNQRLINFASSGYPYRHFSYSPDPPTRLWFSDVNSFPSRFQENWQTTNNKWYIIAEAAWQFKQLSIVYQIWSCQMCFFVPVWSCLW